MGNWLKLWVPIIIVSLIISIALASTVSAQGKYSIPAWVKGVAGFWAEDKITDDEFGEGLSFLIDQNIIKVPQMESLKQKVAQLEAENAILRSQVGGTAPTQSPEDCGPNQVFQLGVCQDIEESPEDCGPNQVFQLGFCQDIEESGPKVFSIETDFTSYDDGDTIRITGNVGTVSKSKPDQPVTIFVIGPDGKIAAVLQTFPSSNGSFSHTLIASGSMQESGEYEVTASYGVQKSTTTFSFEAVEQTPPPPTP